MLAIAAGSITVSAQSLVESIETTVLTLPYALEGNLGSWCTWGTCSISPRLYHAPRTDGSTLVGWTDSSDNGHVSLVSNDSITTTHDLVGTPLKGLVAHDDGSFTVLRWDEAAATMWLSKFTGSGVQVWSTNLNSTIAVFDDWLGDSRLAFGDDTYAAYYTVYGISGTYSGHHGDQLKLIDSHGSIISGGWTWGCSHSMAELVGYHPGLDRMTAVCSSDCYVAKGLIVNDSRLIVEADGSCTGRVSLQLGQMAAASSEWKVIFNAYDTGCCEAKGIGLATIDGSYASTLVWLTDTNGSNERDPVLAALGTESEPESYLVGWMTENDDAYRMAIIDPSGAILQGPELVSGVGIRWGNRDDSLKTRPDGSVSWAQGDAYSSTLRLFRYSGNTIFSDGFESSDASQWTASAP